MDQKNQLRTSFKKAKENELRSLKKDELTLIMTDTDPNHAYGPNYYMLPKELKTYYKYIRMRKYVHVKLEDEKEIIGFNFKFYGAIVSSALGVYFLSKGIDKFILKNYFKSAHRHVKKLPVMYFGVPASIAGSLCYGYMNAYFIRNYCVDFLENYRAEAVSNGFEDYPISEDKIKHSWTNFYHLFRI